jgi:hypothetical protein
MPLYQDPFINPSPEEDLLDVHEIMPNMLVILRNRSGRKLRITSFLFCLELLGACVALVVLFADSLYALVPGLRYAGDTQES